MMRFLYSEAKDTAKKLRRMSVETNSFVCLGCGQEHNCGICGCVILNRAAELLDTLADESLVAAGRRRFETREDG